MAKHRFPWKWWLKDLKVYRPNVSVFSCFSCGGGSSMGYKLAGFRVVGNLEIDHKVNEIYRKNLHPDFSFCEDIRDFVKRSTFPEELQDLTILDGSPPCTSFSTAGLREKAWGKEKKFHEGQCEQRLDDLFFPFIGLCGKLRPKICVAENVPGILTGNAKIYSDAIVSAFHAIGYDVQIFRLNSADCGVPQSRNRVFFIANRCGFRRLSLEFHEQHITAGEVLDFSLERKPVSSRESRKILDARRAGERSLKAAALRLYGRESYYTDYVIQPGQVAPVIAASNHIYFPDKTECRIEDFRDLATFPQDYDFSGGSRKNAQFLTGMCVPPVLTANIAEEIYLQWLNNHIA